MGVLNRMNRTCEVNYHYHGNHFGYLQESVMVCSVCACVRGEWGEG